VLRTSKPLFACYLQCLWRKSWHQRVPVSAGAHILKYVVLHAGNHHTFHTPTPIMIFTPLITLVACSLGAAANLTHVPQGVELVAPASTVSANSTFELGYNEDFGGKLEGFQHNVTIGLVYPNGASHKVAQFTSLSTDNQNACDTPTSLATLAKVTLADVGK
jgi:hypothetical protein